MIDEARKEGIDLQFDTLSLSLRSSVLDVLLPRWFREGLPENFENAEALARLESELRCCRRWWGWGLRILKWLMRAIRS